MTTEAIRREDVATLTWGLVFVLALSAVFIAAGVPTGPLFLIGVVAALIFTFRYTYIVFYVAVALTPFLGVMVSLPTGALQIGRRAFGGAIDTSLAEAVLFAVLAAWALKLVLLWRGRRDVNWRPKLPLIGSYAFLFLAHVASAFSPLEPDRVLAMKYALRPVLFDFLAFIALPVNLIRSRRRFIITLSVFAGVGFFAALNGFVSVFFPTDSSALVGRAHPFPMFGIHALGENHNELADLLVVIVPFTLALAELARNPRMRRLLFFAAGFEFVIGLLTFTRTAWIVFAAEGLVLGATVWRAQVKKHLAKLALAAVILLPLAVAMAAYSVSMTAQSSNSTRLALTEIALELFRSSPWIGAGAGTFVDRVGSTRVFLLEYGDPLDSHGFLQKLAAETGVLGLAAFGIVLVHLGSIVLRGVRRFRIPSASAAWILLAVGCGGEILYQLFNTDYWTGKMWLPIGLLLAAWNVLEPPPTGAKNGFSGPTAHDTLNP